MDDLDKKYEVEDVDDISSNVSDIKSLLIFISVFLIIVTLILGAGLLVMYHNGAN
jgi:cell division protein FtsX